MNKTSRKNDWMKQLGIIDEGPIVSKEDLIDNDEQENTEGGIADGYSIRNSNG